MLGPYRDILSRPGALAFSMSGAVARLPMSVLGIAIVLLVSDTYGSYALAGQVAAAYVVAQALVAPKLGRWVDRFGQSRIMRPALTLAGVGLTGLLVAGSVGAPPWTLFVSAALAGATMGSVGAMARARWTHVLSDDRRLETAYALESALDEVVFAIGPLAATFLATAVDPAAALLLPLVAGVGGGFWFLAQTQTEPPPVPQRQGAHTRSVLRTRGMVPLVLIFVALGGVFGATELATVAFATEQGNAAYAGPVLASFAFGSLAAGVVYGSRHWVGPLARRFLVGVVALALGTGLFQLVSNPLQLAGVMLVAGLAISPTLIAGNGLVQNLVEPERLTEGLTWLGTTLSIGVSLSATLAGLAIDADGAHGGFLIVTASAAIAVILAAVSLRWLRPARTPTLSLPPAARGDAAVAVLEDGRSAGGTADEATAAESPVGGPAGGTSLDGATADGATLGGAKGDATTVGGATPGGTTAGARSVGGATVGGTPVGGTPVGGASGRGPDRATGAGTPPAEATA